ncbi:PIN domain-like protein [Anaeromyces robustus]|uniref:PIN domain-like protein n=1 Tax=Anaeromyces robustus TaxID=1754192 RepID=A0A1Y1XJP9_9FUNG|nr:PIN domain-like protein [Anaeromyces robustus]|eukprot:ORX85584.1 PIN domain-like protein [Anaeromyces robustus]
MGVRTLNSYVNSNIRPQYNKWILNKKLYKKLVNFKTENELDEYKNATDKPITLIIDALAYLYYVSNKLNWFIYDNLKLFNLLKKQLHLFLAINNLEKIIFVFDGINIPLKEETEIQRRNEKINSINEFFNRILYSPKIGDKNLPKMISPSSLVFMTYIQFLIDSSKLFKNVEVKFSVFEADAYISKLSTKFNGYVLSNDSDFFIYKTSGYINFKSLEFPDIFDIENLEFPKNYIDNNENGIDFIIKFELYTRNQILNHFSLNDDTLPIFATLCSNDYLKIDNYPRLKQYFKYYKNMKERININSLSKSYQYDNHLTLIQNQIIDNICKYKPKEQNQTLELEFRDKLIDSVKQYNTKTISSDNSINPMDENCLDDFLTTKMSFLNTEILNNYYSGNLYSELLNVLLKDQFKCTQYFEDINKSSCWNITKNIRKDMFNLIIKSNNIDQNNKINGNNQSTYIIEEICRNNNTSVTEKLIINSSNDNIFSKSINDRFIEYLTIFNSNLQEVKSLPYYLIPITISLRFLLNEKVKHNSFIYKNNDKFYAHLSNKKKMNSESITNLYSYELEALLASSIAALSFTYLNISYYLSNKKQSNIKTVTSIFDIKNNLNENNLEKRDWGNNIYNSIKKNKGRCLQLKNYWNIENLNKNQLRNGIQIYAEFRNVLIVNSYILQILKLNSDLPEFSSFFSMYHYLWEESFYSMIDFFKISTDKKISFIFNHLYTIDKNEKEKVDSYINYLEEIYIRLLNIIVSY